MNKINCLDTFALFEILNKNPHYAFLKKESFVITELTLVEFYKVLLRKYGKKKASYWLGKFIPFSQPVDLFILVKAVEFWEKHKEERITFFDSVGYIFSLEKGHVFVTGDKEFKEKKNVLFLPSLL